MTNKQYSKLKHLPHCVGPSQMLGEKEEWIECCFTDARFDDETSRYPYDAVWWSIDEFPNGIIYTWAKS